jgi:hypothetical protein
LITRLAICRFAYACRHAPEGHITPPFYTHIILICYDVAAADYASETFMRKIRLMTFTAMFICAIDYACLR